MALNLMLQSWLLLIFLFVFHSFVIPICHCQSNSPQNIETFFPIEAISSAPSPNSPTQRPEPPTKPQPTPPSQEQLAPALVAVSKSSSSNRKIAKAVAATAASTLVVSGLIFFLVLMCLRARRRKEDVNTASPGDRRVVPQTNVFERIDGNLRGLIIDENGLDVVYWRKLEGKNSKKGLQKEALKSAKKNKEKQVVEDDHERNNQGKKKESIQEIPLLRGKSSTSHIKILPEEEVLSGITRKYTASALPPVVPASAGAALKNVENKPDSPVKSYTPYPLPSPPTPLFNSLSAIPKTKSPAPPPPPPPIPVKRSPAPPPPPPIPIRKSPAPPPPPPKASSLKSSSKPLPIPIERPTTTSKPGKPSGEGVSETGNGKVKLKPLHWDKVNTNADHSMVWDKIDRGSFRVDQDLMEALFGYAATSRRSPKGKNNSTCSSRDVSAPSSKTFLLDPRKSQNIAIVLKSLAVSREEILDALNEGQGLNADTIEKLSRVAPTEEEQSQILEYKGHPTKLAAAESFLYHILNAVPSAFKRLNAMFFRLNYDSEILHIKVSLQTLELGCKELRNRGLFLKLLEAVLKAGNRMNAGTSRGNAQAFNLNSLRKLSDVKSTDGKTTLLNFVVEQVVRSEGKRLVLNRNRSLNRSSSRSSYVSGNSLNSTSDEQREKEYMTLGLPIVGGISAEFSNVKKAAIVDYNDLVSSISSLSTRMDEIRKLVSQFKNVRGVNFVIEMEHFLENAEEELKLVREEQARVMQLVKRTTQYYQGGVSKDSAKHPIQIFVIIKDFLGMVDQACIEIARTLQRRKTAKEISE